MSNMEIRYNRTAEHKSEKASKTNGWAARVGMLTFLHHAHTQALLKAAVLAAVASPLVHRTVFTGEAHILGVFLHGALENQDRSDNQPPNTINT